LTEADQERLIRQMEDIEPNPFQGYDKYYARTGNVRPDWLAATQHPQEYATRKPWLPTDRQARILDFGCGWGHQLLGLWCAGYRNLEGVEISPEQARIAQAGIGGRARIYCIDGRDLLKDKKRAYDLITLNDVIEHVPPSSALPLLRSLWEAMDAGGRLVVRTPNSSSLLASYSRYIDVTHVAGYTEWSLMQLLDESGFVEHRLVEEETGCDPRSWRPWAPLRGLGLRSLLNVAIHRIVYAARSQRPVPKCIGYNIEIYSHKAKGV
jgi:2-polyprenyl-3-methyl-5-hydroxy-6-metoxy-1,4-benzoquinol methylase